MAQKSKTQEYWNNLSPAQRARLISTYYSGKQSNVSWSKLTQSKQEYLIKQYRKNSSI